MAHVADKYLIVHSVCVKCLHETNVQTSWSSESGNTNLVVRLSLLRKTILIPEYQAFMCVCVFVDGCISQF